MINVKHSNGGLQKAVRNMHPQQRSQTETLPTHWAGESTAEMKILKGICG
jgi:hypothetical protein